MAAWLVVALLASGAVVCAAPAQAPDGMLTEWHGADTVISDPCPEMYWQCGAQTACQVVVGTGEQQTWDSGELNTPVPAVEYAGPALVEQQAYWWRVRVWDADGPSPWSERLRFTYERRPRPMVRPHIRTFMNFGGSAEFAAANLDLSFRAEPNQVRPDILALRYSLLATMVIPSPKAEALEQFCVEEGLTDSGIVEDMFCHFSADTQVTLHVGAERASNPRETRLVPGWDPSNDRDGDGVVDEAEAADLVNPGATARRKSQARIPIYYWGPPRDDFVMNVGHRGYQQFVAQVYCPAQAEGFDGLYVDTMPPDVPAAGRSAQVLEFPRPPEAPHQWLHAMQTMLARIKAALPDAPITANGWHGRPFVIDGLQSEGWLKAVTPVAQYERVLEQTAHMDARGKIQMIQYNPIFHEKLSEFGEKAPIEHSRDVILGLASYYLVHGDHTYYAYGRHPYAGVQELWPPVAAVDIGIPTGPYRLFAQAEAERRATGPNLLPNGEFETDDDGDLNPDEWDVVEPVELDETVKHSGRYSARIDSDTTRINNFSRNYVTLKANTSYTLVCHIKTQDVVGSPGAQVYPYEFEGATGGGMVTVTGATDWREYSMGFRTADDPTGRINFRMYGATGVAWFDDIRLFEGAFSDWKVFARDFTKALVLVKPYGGGRWDDSTATEHRLPGTLTPLRADGTTGAPANTIRLRSGEAAILLKP